MERVNCSKVVVDIRGMDSAGKGKKLKDFVFVKLDNGSYSRLMDKKRRVVPEEDIPEDIKTAEEILKTDGQTYEKPAFLIKKLRLELNS